MSDPVLVKKFLQIVESIELTKLTEYLFRYLFDLQERRIFTVKFLRKRRMAVTGFELATLRYGRKGRVAHTEPVSP